MIRVENGVWFVANVGMMLGESEPLKSFQCFVIFDMVSLFLLFTNPPSLFLYVITHEMLNVLYSLSGGVVDGDDKHPYYRYGGLWKNRRAQQQQQT